MAAGGEARTAGARTHRPLDPQTLAYGLAQASDPQVRPGGVEVVYSVATVDPDTRRMTSRLWWFSIGNARPRPLTPAGQDVCNPRWSPDGTSLACTVTCSEQASNLIVLEPWTGAGRRLARHVDEIGDMAWSPDGRRIAYTTRFDPENPNEESPLPGAAPAARVVRRLDYKLDGLGFVGESRSQLFVADVDGEAGRRLTGDPVDHEGPRWSPDGRSILVCIHGRDRTGMQLALVDPTTGAVEPVGPRGGLLVSWSWSPTGEQVFFAADPDLSLQPDYYVYGRRDRTVRRLTDDLLSFPTGAPPVWLDPDHVLVHATRSGGSRLERVDVTSGHVEVVADYRSRNSGLALDRTCRQVIQGQTTPMSLGEISVHDLDDDVVRTVTAHNAPVLVEHPPAAWETFQVERGGATIDAWLLKPPGFDPSRRYPVILDVHGGPSDCYGYGFLAHEQCLATNGFLVVYANPRGSTSYGRHFAQQVVRDWGGGDYQDLIAVLDAVLERPYADAGRTGIFGISYGGFMTSWAIGHTDRFAAAVCGEPIFDLQSDYGTSDVAFKGLEHHGGGPPHLEPEWYRAHSPSTFAHRTRTPTLIFHGEADERCPIGQSEQMFVALHKAGCEVEFVRYPGGSHMFFAYGLPEHRADFLTRTLDWFKRHLGEPSEVAAG